MQSVRNWATWEKLSAVSQESDHLGEAECSQSRIKQPKTIRVQSVRNLTTWEKLSAVSQESNNQGEAECSQSGIELPGRS